MKRARHTKRRAEVQHDLFAKPRLRHGREADAGLPPSDGRCLATCSPPQVRRCLRPDGYGPQERFCAVHSRSEEAVFATRTAYKMARDVIGKMAPARVLQDHASQIPLPNIPGESAKRYKARLAAHDQAQADRLATKKRQKGKEVAECRIEFWLQHPTNGDLAAVVTADIQMTREHLQDVQDAHRDGLLTINWVKEER